MRKTIHWNPRGLSARRVQLVESMLAPFERAGAELSRLTGRDSPEIIVDVTPDESPGSHLRPQQRSLLAAGLDIKARRLIARASRPPA